MITGIPITITGMLFAEKTAHPKTFDDMLRMIRENKRVEEACILLSESISAATGGMFILLPTTARESHNLLEIALAQQLAHHFSESLEPTWSNLPV